MSAKLASASVAASAAASPASAASVAAASFDVSLDASLAAASVVVPALFVDALLLPPHPATQTGQIDNFITEGVDVLIINPVNSSSAATITDKVVAAGIPLVYINREPDRLHHQQL